MEKIRIEDLKPYKNNPRKNDLAVKDVMDSISKYGFINPILIDKNNEIISGHTRIKAANKLGIEEVPYLRIEHLTEKQIKEFRIIDNKTAEKAEWDFDLLGEELKDIGSNLGFEFNMNNLDFNFTPEEEKKEDTIEVENMDPVEKESSQQFHRLNTITQANLEYYNSEFTDGDYNMPIIDGCDYVPEELQGFNYVLNDPDYSKTVHFYLDDYQFERVWNRPDFYIEKLLDFRACLTPDFSLYLNMPIAMQVWNTYRSRLIGQIMEISGIKVIPTVSWSRKNSFDFCFDGLPKNKTLSISTIGIKENEDQFRIWQEGMDEMFKRLSPKNLIVYGGEVNYEYPEYCNVYYYDNAVTERLKMGI